jgi:copper resistance protein C
MNVSLRRARQLLLLAIVFSLVAAAHAILVKSIPGANETVSGPNVPITLTFNSKIDQARSALTLEAPDHASSRVQIDVDSSAPAKLSARLSNLGAGSYKLKWQVLAVDGHITRGEIAFHVK